ncbi:MAG TPA: SRPBCC family protein [Solirubrobacteraceae bacterium]|nr:SRPBCC family protein [Solirubrobacteraceae bacterium]
MKAGDVLEMKPLGVRMEVLRSDEETDGELFEMEVTGRPRGFLDQRHIHPEQTERIEVIEGRMKVTMNGREHILSEGQSIAIPPGTPHTQVPIGVGQGRIRITALPAGRTAAFLERLAKLCRDGQVMRAGFPRPVAGAELVLEFSGAGYAAAPPLRVQRALARAVIALARPMRPYLFVDEWDVAAPAEAVFDAIADSRSYPQWWRPVYLDVQADGPAAPGTAARHHFKGRLPYHLHTRSVVVEIDPPRRVVADVDGDLRGRGTWTLTPAPQGTHVRFDWQVHADRLLLRALTPVLRPIFRWNHNWAIARAKEGLEPYARSAHQRYDAPAGVA